MASGGGGPAAPLLPELQARGTEERGPIQQSSSMKMNVGCPWNHSAMSHSLYFRVGSTSTLSKSPYHPGSQFPHLLNGYRNCTYLIGLLWRLIN